jgi:hypothetical protein
MRKSSTRPQQDVALADALVRTSEGTDRTAHTDGLVEAAMSPALTCKVCVCTSSLALHGAASGAGTLSSISCHGDCLLPSVVVPVQLGGADGVCDEGGDEVDRDSKAASGSGGGAAGFEERTVVVQRGGGASAEEVGSDEADCGGGDDSEATSGSGGGAAGFEERKGEEEDCRVLTWNVMTFGHNPGKDVDTLISVVVFTKPDVVFIQELIPWKGDMSPDVKRFFDKMGRHDYTFVHPTDWTGPRGGQNLPVMFYRRTWRSGVVVDGVPKPVYVKIANFCRKPIVFLTTVSMPDGAKETVAFISVHLDDKRGDDEFRRLLASVDAFVSR